MIESPVFNSLDIVTHNNTYEKLTLIESLLPDDCDAVSDNHMSDIIKLKLDF